MTGKKLFTRLVLLASVVCLAAFAWADGLTQPSNQNYQHTLNVSNWNELKTAIETSVDTGSGDVLINITSSISADKNQSLDIAAGKIITLSLDVGVVLAMSGDAASVSFDTYYDCFVGISNDGYLTITGSGSIDVKGVGIYGTTNNYGYSAVAVYNNGSLDVTGGVLSAAGANNSGSGGTCHGGRGYAIYNNGGDVDVTGGELSAKGGNGSSGSAGRGYAIYSNGGDVDVANGVLSAIGGTGGSIKGNVYAIYSEAGSLDVTNSALTAENGNNMYGIYKSGDAGDATVTSCEVNVSGDSTFPVYAIYNTNNGTMTVTGGTFTVNGNSSTAIFNNGTMAVTDGTFTANGKSSTTISNKGTTTVTSGEFTANGTTGETNAISNSSGTTTVNGGTFTANGTTGDTSAIYCYSGSLDVTAGTFTATGTTAYAIKNSSGTTTVTAGTFTASGDEAYAIYNDKTVTVMSGKFAGNLAPGHKLIGSLYGGTYSNCKDTFAAGMVAEGCTYAEIDGSYVVCNSAVLSTDTPSPVVPKGKTVTVSYNFLSGDTPLSVDNVTISGTYEGLSVDLVEESMSGGTFQIEITNNSCSKTGVYPVTILAEDNANHKAVTVMNIIVTEGSTPTSSSSSSGCNAGFPTAALALAGLALIPSRRKRK